MTSAQTSSYHVSRPPPSPIAVIDKDYDYKAVGVMIGSIDNHDSRNGKKEILDGDEALMDLAHLEELHQEAEKMKALGNKHMASQEYSKAYNAYSAALQLSPVGPSSHVFLSNRAAALLSLKRYHAAATDARRAVALAPTFGKAHARLGQALYFQKEYPGAVAAYEDALLFEPDNQVTRTYLEKAKKKMEKREVGAVSVGGETASHMDKMSLATDPNHVDNVVSSGYRMQSPALSKAVAGNYNQKPALTAGINNNRTSTVTTTPSTSANSTLAASPSTVVQDDPDFDEALKIQQRANKYLTNKQYKAAIEEFTAALFLVPDDPFLSPDLHLGRAHALNGSRRHERAKIDAQMAIKINPSPAAYSTLAKSLFYLRDFRGAIDAFQSCMDLLPNGEALGMFDQAYLSKAEAALEEEEASLKKAGMVGGGNQTVATAESVIPKLPPPRFVPREKAIQSTPNLPPMPKEWPQQTPATVAFKCGPERDVIFLSEYLGIKLNRGADGIVRVLHVAPNTPGSPVARSGHIESGDVVREAAGVDIRRPITNIMWGDTVALIKMAPRPIRLVVAKELSPVPSTFVEEQRKAAASASVDRTTRLLKPSNANADDAVAKDDSELGFFLVEEDVSRSISMTGCACIQSDESLCDVASIWASEQGADAETANDNESVKGNDSHEEVYGRKSEIVDDSFVSGEVEVDNEAVHDESLQLLSSVGKEGLDGSTSGSETTMLRNQEDSMVGGEILFERTSKPAYAGWDNLRWLSYSGARRVRFCQPCYRLVKVEQKKNLFWFSAENIFEPRLLVIYEDPPLILILRRSYGINEIRDLLSLPDVAEVDTELVEDKFWVVESVIEPVFCKLRLSFLTTATSLPPENSDERRKSCFELITPIESTFLSAVKIRSESNRREQSFKDSVAFLETVATESAIIETLCSAHDQNFDLGIIGEDISWKHKLILGTLHSHIVTRNTDILENAIRAARDRIDPMEKAKGRSVPVIDDLDNNGLPPLYYACVHRVHVAVSCLVAAGASVDAFQVETNGMTFAHLCARNLDCVSLSTVLSSPCRPDPNALDLLFRTPMYVAVTEGTTAIGGSDLVLLEKCIKALEAWGGQMILANLKAVLPHPIALLCEQWKPDEVAFLLQRYPFRYPLPKTEQAESNVLLGAVYNYPVHRALAFRQASATAVGFSLSDSCLLQVLRLLFEHGFEPNERCEAQSSDPTFDKYDGHTPLQVLATAAFELEDEEERTEKSFLQIESLVKESAVYLIRNGARLSILSPFDKKLTRGTTIDEKPVGFEKRSLSKHLAGLKRTIGGDSRLKEIEAEWNSITVVDATENVKIFDDSEPNHAAISVIGRGSEKSCAICWKIFGKLTNRKHLCCVTLHYICEECSAKRLRWHGKDFRVSDGQFLLGQVDAAKCRKKLVEATIEKDFEELTRIQNGNDDGHFEKQKLNKEEFNRNTLFRDIVGRATNFVTGEGHGHSQPQTVHGLSATLNETRNALLDRGEKINSLGEKSSKLVDSSADFARMARELRKKTEGGGFW